MLLSSGERLVLSEACESAGGQNRMVGTLYLTNFRLVFEVKEGGGLLRAPKEVTMIDCPFGQILNAAVSKPVLGRPVLLVETGGTEWEFKVADPSRWEGEIARIRATPVPSLPPAPAPSTPPPPPPPQEIVRDTIEREVVKIRCQHCGALNSETDNECSACGAPL